MLDAEVRAREEWARRNLTAPPPRKPRKTAPDRYPGQVYDHSCGVSKTARARCKPCAMERSFKPAKVERVERVPRSPSRIFHLEYALMEDFMLYGGDAGAGWPLRVRGRLPVSVGDTVWVRWSKRPRARRWRLEVRLEAPGGST